MRTKLANAIPYLAFVGFGLLGTVTKGFVPWVIDFVKLLPAMLTWYYISIGLITFFFAWLPRYRAVKRMQHDGTLYLALVQEKFGK